MTNFLKYGDLVVFYHSTDDRMARPNSRISYKTLDRTGGILTAMGYIDSGLYFQQLPDSKEFDQKQARTASTFAGLHEGVFKITPRLNYDTHKEFKKIMDRYRSLEEVSKLSTKEEEVSKFQAIKEDLAFRSSVLQDRLKKEQMLNASIVRESLGTPIKYGTEIQLMHLDSSSFIAASKQASRTETIGYNIYLSNWFSSSMIFQLMPRYKSRQEGDSIQINDYLLIKNTSRDGFIDISESNEYDIFDDRFFGSHENPYCIDTQVIEQRAPRVTAYLAQEARAAFQVLLYRTYNESTENELLRGGDLVRVSHTEIDADLCADIAYSPDRRIEVFFRKYEGEYKEETNSVASYFYLEHEVLDKAGESFKLGNQESESPHAQNIQLRHFLTNRLITSSQNAESDSYDLMLADNVGEQEKSLKVVFEPVVRRLPVLVNNQTVFVKEISNGAYLRYNKAKILIRDSEVLMPLLKSTDPEYEFAPLNEGDLNERRYAASLLRDFSSENAYQISRVSAEEYRECMFLRSALPLLRHLGMILKRNSNQEIEFKRSIFEKVQRALQMMICFLFDKEDTTFSEYFDIEDEPIVRRQKMFRDNGIITSLIDVVYRTFRYRVATWDSLQGFPDLLDTLKFAQTTMRYAIKEYRPNELYLSQWIALITEQSIQLQGYSDISAGRTLIELIDNNKRILETRISQKTIQRFVDFLLESRDAHFVDILRVICICDKQPMIRNQKEIAEMLLNDPGARERLVFELTADQLDGVLFQFDIIEMLPLRNLEVHSLTNDGGKLYNYVVVMTRLLADLCKGRNYVAIDSLHQDFSFEVCFEIVSNEEYPRSLRDAFCTLMCTLWVDVSPFQRIELPIKIKVWDENKSIDLNVFQNKEIEKFSGLKKYIMDYLRDIRRDTAFEMKRALVHTDERTENRWSLDLAILRLTELMLKLGIVKEVAEINQILTYLKNYLKAEKSQKNKTFGLGKTFSRAVTLFNTVSSTKNSLVQSDEEETFQEIEVPFLVAECKRKVCEILEFGLLRSNELRIVLYLQSFKTAIEELDPQVLYFLDQIIAHSDENGEASTQANTVLASILGKSSEEHRLQLTKKMDDLFFKVTKDGTDIKIDKEEELLSSLVELLLYKDPKIKLSSLNMLHSLHNQRHLLGTSVFELQIIDDEGSLEHFERAKEYCMAINTLGDTIEKWSQEPGGPEMTSLAVILNKIYRSLLNIQKKNLPDKSDRVILPEILNITYKFNEAFANLKGTDQNTLNVTDRSPSNLKPPKSSGMARMSVDITGMFGGRRAKVSATYLDLKNQMNLTDIHQYHMDSESEIIDPFEQDLFRNSGIYDGLIKIVKFDSESIGNHTRSEESVHILRKIYRIFAKSSKDSMQNKHYLTKFIDIVIFKHFQEAGVDLNASFLVRELVEDNKLILLDEAKVTWVVDQVCKINSNLDPNDIRRAFHFCILQRILHYKKLILRNNQNIILTKLVSKDYPNLLISFEQSDSKRDALIGALSIPLIGHVAKIGTKDVLVLPHVICFAKSSLDLLSACSEEKNPFGETVCQSLLAMETISTMLGSASICMPLKHSLVKFLYFAHLDHDREVPYHMVEVFLRTFEKLVDEYRYCMKKSYLSLLDGVDMELLMVVTHEAYTSWQQVIEDYLMIILDCFQNIVKRNLGLVFDSEPAKAFLKNQENIFKITSEERMTPNSKVLERKIEDIIKQMQNRNRGNYVGKMIQSIDRQNGQDTTKANKESAAANQRAILRSSKVKTNIGSRIGLFKKIEALIELYFSSREFKTRCFEEFYELVTNLSMTQQYFASAKTKVDWSKLVSSMAGFLNNSLLEQSSSSKQSSNMIVGIKIFRNYLEGEELTKYPSEPPNIFPDRHWKVNKPAIKFRQEQLCRLGIFELICRIISFSDSKQLIKEALLLSLAMLWGGHSDSQAVFLSFVESDSENRLMCRLKDIMLESFGVVQKNMEEKNALATRDYLMNQDPSLSLRQDLEKEGERDKLLQKIRNEVEDFEMNQVLCASLFKFLHLLCEGHNNDVQNILRLQKAAATGSVNLIATTASLWGSFVKITNPHCASLGEIMLDFMIECMQGPCEGNQMELYSNKLIEFCKDFMSDFMGERDYEVKGFDENNYQLVDGLIVKCIKALQAMAEANSHKEIYHTMGTHIEINYLLSKLSSHFANIFGDVMVDPETSLLQADISELNKKVHGEVFNSSFTEAFELFFFLKTINDHTDKYRKSLSELHGIEALIFCFFTHHSAHIEIVFKNVLQKIYFVVHPACKFLEDDEKNKFLDTANRSTPVEKVNDFIQQSPKFFDRIDQMANLRKRCPWVSENLFVRSRNLCFLIVLVINLYMLFTLDREVRGNVMRLKVDPFGNVFLKLLGVLHIIASIWTASIWSLIHVPLVLVDGWREILNEIKKLTLSIEETAENRVQRQEMLLLLEQSSSDLTSQDIHLLMTYRAKITRRSFNPGKFEIGAFNVIFLMSHKYLVFFIFYTTASILAISLDIKILYVLHLFELIVASLHRRTCSTPSATSSEPSRTTTSSCCSRLSSRSSCSTSTRSSPSSTSTTPSGRRQSCPSVRACATRCCSASPQSWLWVRGSSG